MLWWPPTIKLVSFLLHNYNFALLYIVFALQCKYLGFPMVLGDPCGRVVQTQEGSRATGSEPLIEEVSGLFAGPVLQAFASKGPTGIFHKEAWPAVMCCTRPVILTVRFVYHISYFLSSRPRSRSLRRSKKPCSTGRCYFSMPHTLSFIVAVFG